MARREVREVLAACMHDIWAHWMNYLFTQGQTSSDGKFILPYDVVERWKRQIRTDYPDLSELEKLSDLKQADKVLLILKSLGIDV